MLTGMYFFDNSARLIFTKGVLSMNHSIIDFEKKLTEAIARRNEEQMNHSIIDFEKKLTEAIARRNEEQAKGKQAPKLGHQPEPKLIPLSGIIETLFSKLLRNLGKSVD